MRDIVVILLSTAAAAALPEAADLLQPAAADNGNTPPYQLVVNEVMRRSEETQYAYMNGANVFFLQEFTERNAWNATLDWIWCFK